MNLDEYMTRLARELSERERECVRLGRENDMQCDEIHALRERLAAAERELEAVLTRSLKASVDVIAVAHELDVAPLKALRIARVALANGTRAA